MHITLNYNDHEHHIKLQWTWTSHHIKLLSQALCHTAASMLVHSFYQKLYMAFYQKQQKEQIIHLTYTQNKLLFLCVGRMKN